MDASGGAAPPRRYRTRYTLLVPLHIDIYLRQFTSVMLVLLLISGLGTYMVYIFKSFTCLSERNNLPVGKPVLLTYVPWFYLRHTARTL
jgi:hypothetical protein